MIDQILRRMNVQQSDIPYYVYGVKIFSEMISVQIICILYAFYNHQTVDYLIFYSIFLFLRQYGGGFHFRDFFPCFVTSVLSIIGILKLISCMTLSASWAITMCFASLTLIVILGPVPSIVESPSEAELAKRRSKLNRLAGLLSGISLFLFFFAKIHFLRLMSVTLTFSALVMAAGKLRQYYYRLKYKYTVYRILR